MAKAAQASLMKLLADDKENKDKVQVALVTAGGPVSLEKPLNNPPNVASKFWELYEQKRGSWEFEVRFGW